MSSLGQEPTFTTSTYIYFKKDKIQLQGMMVKGYTLRKSDLMFLACFVKTKELKAQQSLDVYSLINRNLLGACPEFCRVPTPPLPLTFKSRSQADGL